MGGKGSQPAPPAATPTDNSALMGQMQQMIQGMMAMQGASMAQIAKMSQQNQMPPIPEVLTQPEVDWSEKASQLRNRMSANYALDRARKIGQQDTVLTSPLLDDEDPNLTSPIVE